MNKSTKSSVTKNEELEYTCAEDAIKAKLHTQLCSYAKDILALVIKTINYSVYDNYADKLNFLSSIQDEQMAHILLTYPFINDMFFYTLLAETDYENKISLAKISSFFNSLNGISAGIRLKNNDLMVLPTSADFKLSDQLEWKIQYFSNSQSSFLTKCKNDILDVENYINTTVIVESLDFLALFWHVFSMEEQNELLNKMSYIYEKISRVIDAEYQIKEDSLEEEITRYKQLKEKLEKIKKISSSAENTVSLWDKTSADAKLFFHKLAGKEPLSAIELQEGLCLIKFWLKLSPESERVQYYSTCRDALSRYLKELENNGSDETDMNSIKVFLGKYGMLPLNFENDWMWRQIASTVVRETSEIHYARILQKCADLNASLGEYISLLKKEIRTIQSSDPRFSQDRFEVAANSRQISKNTEEAKEKLYYCCHRLCQIMNKSSLFGIPPFSLKNKIDRYGRILETRDEIEYWLYNFAAETYLHFTQKQNSEECYWGRQYIEGIFNKNFLFKLIADNCNKLKQYAIPRRSENTIPTIVVSGDATLKNDEDDDCSIFDMIPSNNTIFDHMNDYNEEFLSLVKEYDLGFFLFLVLYRNFATKEDLKALVAEFKHMPVEELDKHIAEFKHMPANTIASDFLDNEKWNMHELHTFLYGTENFDTRYVANNLLLLSVFIRVEKGIKDYDEILKKICKLFWNTARGKAKSQAEKCSIKTILNQGENI